MEREFDILEQAINNYSEKIKSKYLKYNNIDETILQLVRQGTLKVLHAYLRFTVILNGIYKILKIDSKSKKLKNHIEILNKICFYLDNTINEILNLTSIMK
jgi:hypothetical protein